MRKLNRLEIITVALIFLYQFANKSPDEKLVGIDKMVFFALFGLYSLALTVYEYYNVKKGLAKTSLAFYEGNPGKLDLFIVTVIYFIVAVLLFLNTTVNSRIYLLNIVFGLVYTVKFILCTLLYKRLAEKIRRQSNAAP